MYIYRDYEGSKIWINRNWLRERWAERERERERERESERERRGGEGREEERDKQTEINA